MSASFQNHNGRTRITLVYDTDSSGLVDFFQYLVAGIKGGTSEDLDEAKAMNNQEMLDFWYSNVKKEAIRISNGTKISLEKTAAFEEIKNSATYEIEEE